MHHYETSSGCWYLVDGKPRPVTGCRKQYVFSCNSSYAPHSIKTSNVEPLIINKDLIENSNLRNLHHAEDNVYDSLHIKCHDITLPFTITFNYSEDDPCEVIFPMGTILKISHIHRLQLLIYAIIGEQMRIKMKY